MNKSAVAIPEARPDRLSQDIPLGPKAAQPLASRRKRTNPKSQRFNPIAKADMTATDPAVASK
jgi:hypothetical protein